MDDLIRKLNSMVERSPDALSSRPEIKNKAIIGKFFEAFKDVQQSRRKGCVDDPKSDAKGH